MKLNPFWYFIDGMRYAMVGYHESDLAIGGALILTMILGFGAAVWYLFHIGWRLRE